MTSAKTRFTIVSNANQQVSTIALLCSEPHKWKDAVVTLAKNKLKLKKPSRFFLRGCGPLVLELITESEFLLIVNDATVLVSCGEDYIGKEAVQLANEAAAEADHATVRVLCAKAPLDPAAVKQLEKTAQLPGMLFCVGMPDLHAGNEHPVGAAFGCHGRVYPSLIGGDIGCGMSMYRLDELAAKDVVGNEKRIAGYMREMEGPWRGDVKVLLREWELPSTAFDGSLGTVGRGNHFAEIQVFDWLVDASVLKEVGFDPGCAYLLVHSGSRGLGQSILEAHTQSLPSRELVEGTPEFTAYMDQHDVALRWAKCNRELIARRVFEALNLPAQTKLIDIWHNNVERKTLDDGGTVFLHRKGAAPSDRGLVVIPGSRGSLTYLVRPRPDKMMHSAFSLAHGAGRELSRTKAQAKLSAKFPNKRSMVDELTVNEYGGVVVCEDVELLCEEAPMAYKEVGLVVEDLVDMGIVDVVATLRPLVTYKMRKE